MTPFDLDVTDKLLSTTRAVRKRLDLQRPVEKEIIEQCLDLAVQAPTGSNRQGWRWLVVTDQDKRNQLGALYRKAASAYLPGAAEDAAKKGEKQDARVFESAIYLAEHMSEVPVLVIPCIENHAASTGPAMQFAGLMGSIFPAVWSFQLALRARGLGSCLTTLHLRYAEDAATLLGIPEGIMQVGLLPVAYTIGTDFKPAARPPATGITYWNGWA